MRRIKYYDTLEDDFFKSKDFKINSNYKWIHTSIFYKLLKNVLYFLVLIFSWFYCRLILGVKIKNKRILRNKKGYFIYSNHTLTFGDVFNPFLINFPKKPYILCNKDNLSIPFIGKLLPYIGALPIPEGIKSLTKLKEAIRYYCKDNAIVIYPEAHLWPYATMIRDFSNTSFYFPVDEKKDVFVLTTTYQKSKLLKKPKITIYIDGPFSVDNKLSRKENIKNLHDLVYDTMKKRSENNNYDYIVYEKK